MLYTAVNIPVVGNFFSAQKASLVVGPLMVSTSGARLLRPEAEAVLREELLPEATLITPNLDEAGVLIGEKVDSPEAMRDAARELYGHFGAPVLVKGGHLKGTREAMDIFFDGRTELLLTAPFVKGVRTHGTGCTYSAAICAGLAKGYELPRAVAAAKEFVTKAIAGSYRVGKELALGLPGK